jgi:hypothetical protein
MVIYTCVTAFYCLSEFLPSTSFFLYPGRRPPDKLVGAFIFTCEFKTNFRDKGKLLPGTGGCFFNILSLLIALLVYRLFILT